MVWVSSGGDRQVVWVSSGGGFVTDVGVGQVVQQRQGSGSGGVVAASYVGL